MSFIIRFTGEARLSDSFPALFAPGNGIRRRKDLVLFSPGWVQSKTGPSPHQDRAKVFENRHQAEVYIKRSLGTRARFTEIEEVEIS